MEWSTASEYNSDYFSVERSIDGQTWKQVQEVQAAGNSTSRIDYDWLDQDPIHGLSYYRLKQIDYDGTEELFDAVFVMFRRPRLIKRYNVLGQDVRDGDRGIVIEVYSDGTILKTIK